MNNIPAGYTYTRCDQHTPDEFAALFTFRGDTEPSYNCQEYMKEHPKEVYNTDDEIAVLHMVAPVLASCRKRPHYYSDDIRYFPHIEDPLAEVARNYDVTKELQHA